MTVLHADLDAERKVLGAILSAASYDLAAGHRVFDRARAHVAGGHFYSWVNEALFLQLERLRGEGEPLDAVSVSDAIERWAIGELRDIGVLLEFNVDDLRARLQTIAHEVTSFSMVEHHARIVRRQWELRSALEAAA